MPDFTLSPKAISALRAVSEAIAIDGGKSFDMQDWGVKTTCGTTFCIAGHMLLLADFKPVFDEPVFDNCECGMEAVVVNGFELEASSKNIYQFIKKLYGIPPIVASELFFHDQWPLACQLMYEVHPVRAAQAAIQAFIEKYGPKTEQQDKRLMAQHGERPDVVACGAD